jgi:c-di-GMP-binding flagellar brake protein YcgR
MAALLQLLGFRPRQSASQLREQLPALHSFIDAAVRGGARGQVCFEGLGPKSITTTVMPGMQAGQSVTFTYTNASGKYSFTSTVVAVNGGQATLKVPNTVKALQVFAGARQRAGVRVDTTVNVQWRFTPAGKITTDFKKATISDLSRGGAQLTVDRELKAGSKVDVNVPLDPGGPPALVQAEVRRADKTKSGKFNAGLRFIGLKPETDQAISGFIARRQRDLRNRGLA